VTLPTLAPTAGKRKTKIGRVVSDKMDKTIVVAVERLARHPVYKRVIRLTTKFKAHDEENTAHVGDRVLIEEWRPMSREKRWRLVDVVARAGAPVEMVSEEPETTEALGGPGHPGRSRAEAEEAAAAAPSAEAAAGSAGETAEVARK
jgi:small subunit ribosomal protein S17